MKKAKFGGSILGAATILGAAAALTGCMSGTSAATADLAWVPASIDGRTDMFLEGNRLITAAELGDSTTAIPVDVHVSDWTLSATVHGTTEVVATWEALDVVSGEDIYNATAIDGELNPGGDTPVTLPRGTISIGNPAGSGTIPGGVLDGGEGLIVDWSERLEGLDGAIRADEWEGLEGAHPGCA